ncbi:RNA-directed DNA polymerase from mobile element jockey [Eumeta japonica]|uniref:RNA-directed DNA polymerase from mobile element jockey n=1 Tax=Eumeta variegata TaxID=151549 RepID=A0A4C1V9A1_EUMVA|nr:RNA-directed DNA polymerase from mobile element jockey [Eumeta japonica]
MMSVYPMTTPLHLRLAREFFKFGPPKWGHHHWTVGIVSLTRRRPGIRQHKFCVPHLHPQEKGCGRSANERLVVLAQGLVIAIPKTRKDPRFASSQWPITLLSDIAKLFERIMLRRLHRHLIPREKAFDGVWLPGLLHKLLVNTQIPPALVRTVMSFLEDRSFFITIEDVTSDARPIRAGIPQGSYLSSYFYATFTGHMSTLAVLSRRADLAVVKVQRVVDLLPDWLDKWLVAVNGTKTAALLTGQQLIMPRKLKLRGQ